MSVYIKGFPLPNNCGACPLRLAWCRERIYMVTRPERCPLIPVPPHGDLIERKAAYDSLFSGMVMTGYQSMALDCICEFYVPTIIPAEEGE